MNEIRGHLNFEIRDPNRLNLVFFAHVGDVGLSKG